MNDPTYSIIGIMVEAELDIKSSVSFLHTLASDDIVGRLRVLMTNMLEDDHASE